MTKVFILNGECNSKVEKHLYISGIPDWFRMRMRDPHQIVYSTSLTFPIDHLNFKSNDLKLHPEMRAGDLKFGITLIQDQVQNGLGPRV